MAQVEKNTAFDLRPQPGGGHFMTRNKVQRWGPCECWLQASERAANVSLKLVVIVQLQLQQVTLSVHQETILVLDFLSSN